MFSYNVARCADQTAFLRACALLESGIKELQKMPLLTDVDGTQIQVYCVQGKRIKVVNDYEVDAVYVESEVELDGIK